MTKLGGGESKNNSVLELSTPTITDVWAIVAPVPNCFRLKLWIKTKQVLISYDRIIDKTKCLAAHF